MKSKTTASALSVMLLAALGLASTAHADSCQYSLHWRYDVTQADRNIMAHNCGNGWIEHWWAAEGFADNSDTWGHGFGSDNACNADEPLGRTMNALFLLKFSFSPPNDWGVMSGTPIQFGYPYAAAQFVAADGMQAYCGDFDSSGMPQQYATTFSSWPEDHFEWYMGFFYLENPVERASSLFHESVHRGTGKDHDNDCDDGNEDRSWAYHGAYFWATQWLMDYYLRANSNTNHTYRTWAAQNANARIASKFCANDVPKSIKNWAGASIGSSYNGSTMNP